MNVFSPTSLVQRPILDILLSLTIDQKAPIPKEDIGAFCWYIKNVYALSSAAAPPTISESSFVMAS